MGRGGVRSKGASTESKKRLAAAGERRKHTELVHSLFKQMDADGNGVLDREEIVTLLTHLSSELGIEGESKPTTAEVDMMLHITDFRIRGSQSGSPDETHLLLAEGGSLNNKEELKETMLLWKGYKTLGPLVREKLEEAGLGMSSEQPMSREQLADLLRELNEGVAVSESDIADVFVLTERCGGIKDLPVSKFHTDLIMGITHWYGNVQEVDVSLEPQKSVPAPSPAAQQSDCCVIA